MSLKKNNHHIKDGQKKCRSCYKFKPLDEYWKDKSYDSGLQPSCKSCITKNKKEYRKWEAERTQIVKQILMRYPCQCGESRPEQLVFRNLPDQKNLTARTQWDSPEDLKATLSAQRSQCWACIGQKKPMGNPVPIELTEQEFEALMARRETKLSKALAKGKRTNKQAVTDQFNKLF